MRWSDCHVGNVAQAPVEGQPVVNPKLKVPKGQGVVPDTQEEEDAARTEEEELTEEEREQEREREERGQVPLGDMPVPGLQATRRTPARPAGPTASSGPSSSSGPASSSGPSSATPDQPSSSGA